MHDTFHTTAVAPSLAPAVYAATTKGGNVDLASVNSAVLVVNTGAIAGDGAYAVTIQESDTTTDGDFTDVAAKDLLGALPTTLVASTVYRQGYIGKRRYVRAVITKTSGTSIAAGAVFVLGGSRLQPVGA